MATFDADQLYDYRARRPTLRIRDGRPAELTWPELALRRVSIGSRDILVLSGPEPDFRWDELSAAAIEITRRFGVREWLSLGAIPAAVPHTRAVPLLGTQPGRASSAATWSRDPRGSSRCRQRPSPCSTWRWRPRRVAAVGYFAQIPHDVWAPTPRPRSRSSRRRAATSATVLPSAGLTEEARGMQTWLDAAAAADEATRAYVERLEAMVDEARRPSGGDLIGEIERFLRDQGSGRTDLPNRRRRVGAGRRRTGPRRRGRLREPRRQSGTAKATTTSARDATPSTAPT